MGDVEDFYKEEIEEPISDAAKDVLGDDIYDFLTDDIGGYLTLERQKEWLDKTESFIKDPYGAEEAAEKAARIAEGSAIEGIETLEQQNELLQALYQPYYEQGEQALPILQQMISGTYEAEPSKLYEYQKETGERAIKRRRAAGGSLGSSGREQEMAGFYGDLAAEEAERQYGGVLSQIQLGSGSLEAIQAASGSLSGNVGSIYSNLGAQSSAIAQNLGGARQSAYQTLANTMGNLAVYEAKR